MEKTVHFVPVGFDYERLIIPIMQDQLSADRIVILRSEETELEGVSAELVDRMINKVEEFSDLKGLDVDTDIVEDIYQYEEVYKKAYRMLKGYTDDGWEVYVNISSMPRTVAFAFATAANSLIVEEGSLRGQVHTYYVAPEEYLATEMIEELRDVRDWLERVQEDPDSAAIEPRLADIENLLDKVENKGITEGARELDEEGDRKYVEFPATPLSALRGFEKEVMRALDDMGTAPSISKLAKLMAERRGVDFSESFRSKVQYNISSLEKKGYVDIEERGNRHEAQPSTMGELWADTSMTDGVGPGGLQTAQAD